MADKFNLTGFLKKNQLLNEGIGGYVDIKPVKEKIDGLNMMDEAFKESIDGPNTSPEDMLDQAIQALRMAQQKLDDFRGEMNNYPAKAKRSRAYKVAFMVGKDLNSKINALMSSEI